MKKLFILVAAFFMIFLASCDNKGTEQPPSPAQTYTIKMVYDEQLPTSEEFLLTLDENSSITKSFLTSFINNVDNYEIDNFYNDENYTEETTFPFTLIGNVTLYVKYKESGTFYNVEFNASGVEIPAMRVLEGSTIDLPSPEKEDYEFKGWYKNSSYTEEFKATDTVTSNLTLYAKFEYKYCDFTYNVYGELTTIKVLKNTPLKDLAIPVYAGYDFLGWFTDARCSTPAGDDYVITGAVKLYTKWEKSSYTLTYYIDDLENTLEVTKNTKLDDITKPVLEGYDFAGWYLDEKLKNPVSSDFVMNKNATFYTKWETKKLNIKFLYGEEVLETQRVETGKRVTKPTTKFNINKVFYSWYSDANFENEFNFNNSILSDTNIYAKYLDVAKVDFYNGRTNELLESKTADYDSNVSALLFNPTKTGYEFNGWYSDKYFRIPLENTLKVTKNMSIYAKFTKLNNDVNEAYLYQNSAGGVVEDKIVDFTQYLKTDEYITVSNAKDFLDALKLAKYEYTNDSVTNGVVNQTLVKAGTIHVIEITNDLDLGYNVLNRLNCDMSLVTDHANFGNYYGSSVALNSRMYVYDPIYQSGISQITLSNMYNLLIFSKNNSKITHAGFKINSSNNVVFRNLTMDEIWVWEDSPSSTPTKKIGDYDCWGWAYFKINFSESIWIDNCTFGKSFDGQIDVANTTFTTTTTYSRAPYLPSYDSGVHISNCDFNAGSDDANGYIVKIMNEIEAEYQLYKNDSSRINNKTCLYYFTLRNLGATYEQILYGVAIPQKKGFLLGDTGNSAGGDKFLTKDRKFQADKTYYRINGYEPDGRTKYIKITDYRVDTLISEYTYKINNVEMHDIFESEIPGPDYYNNLNLQVSFSSCRFINIEDRLPNCRGGICYFYNCIVDTTTYLTYRAALSAYKNNIQSNSKYKLALVSQAVITCIGADVYCDTVIYKDFGGDLVKNNNTLFNGDNVKYDYSGYSLQNCLLKKYNEDAKYGSMSYDGTVNPFNTIDAYYASIKNFSFRNDNNEVPFYLYRGVEIDQNNYENAYQLLDQFITNSRNYLKTKENYWLISSYTNLL